MYIVTLYLPAVTDVEHNNEQKLLMMIRCVLVHKYMAKL